MKTYYDISEIFANNDVLCYCEERGIGEVYSRRGNVIIYYSYFGSEGFYKVTKNVKTGRELRQPLRYSTKHPPKFLITENGGTKYNYYVG